MNSVAICVVSAVSAGIFFPVVWLAATWFRLTVWIPLKVSRFMRKRGYSGPELSLFKLDHGAEVQALREKAKQDWELRGRETGNSVLSHDLGPLLYPHLEAWKKRYGDKYLYAQTKGCVQLSVSNRPDLVEEILACKTGAIGKLHSTFADALMGRNSMGVVVDMEEWHRQRRVVNPVFYESKVKEMMETVIQVAARWIQNIEKLVNENGGTCEMDMSTGLAVVTKDIMARTLFGVDHGKAKEGLDNQEKLKILETQSGGVVHPYLRYIPTRVNNEIRRTSYGVTKCITEIIEARRASVRSGERLNYGEDLLGTILEASESGKADTVPAYLARGQKQFLKFSKWTDQEITDQCRGFFFAGHDTVRSSLSWLLIMLGHYTEWQDRIREEIFAVIGGEHPPDSMQIKSLKALNMFVLETMRLYPPFIELQREVYEDGVTLGGEPVPKSLRFAFSMIYLHRLPEIWGDDALDFKPERFTSGLRGACKHPAGFLTFGNGPRICIGQGQALQEVKVLVVMLLQRFRFRLSASYRHLPVLIFSMDPASGVPLVLEKL